MKSNTQSAHKKIASDLLFQHFIEQTPVSIQIHSLDGKLIHSNPAFSKLYTLHKDVLTGLYGLYNILEDKQAVRLGIMPYIERTFAGKTVTFPEYRYDVNETLCALNMTHPASKACWVKTQGFPIKDDNGNITQAVFISEDITSRKKAEAEINRLYDLSGDLIGIADFDGTLKQINPAWEATLGYSTEELHATRFQDLIHPDDIEKTNKGLESLTAGDKIIDFENRYVHKDGSIRHISWTITPIVAEKNLYAIGHDITERKKAAEALVESEEKFRLLVEQSPLPILIFKTNGFLDQVNASWQNMWGLSDAGLLDVMEHYNILTDEVSEEYGHTPHVVRAFNGEPIVLPLIEFDAKEAMERVGKKIHAKKVWIFTRYYPVKNKDGDVVKVVGMVEDYTERKLWEEEILNYQQRLKDLALELIFAEEKQRKQIAADLHDDVGQLLASSRMQIAVIDPSMDKVTILDKMKDISHGLRGAITATQQAIFELRPPQLNKIGLEAALSDWMEEELETKYGIKAIVLGKDKKFDIDDDVRYLLFRCVRELLINVIKHAQATQVIVDLVEKNDVLTISVFDNGIGFHDDPDVLGLKGSGFGLFSIRERIQNIGGALHIDSSTGSGTEILLSLPLHSQHELIL